MQRGSVYIPIADYEYTLANEIKGDFDTHIASATYHVAADTTNTMVAGDSSTLATVLLLANELKAFYNAHLCLSGVHTFSDTSNIINSPDAQDEAGVFAVLNEMKVKYTAHIGNAHVHLVADTTDVITSTNAYDDTPDIDIGLSEGNALLVQLYGSGCTGTVDFQSTLDGATFTNTPYILKDSITASKSVSQIADPGAAASYIVLPPMTQARIACAVTVGYAVVTYREIKYNHPFDIADTSARAIIEAEAEDALEGENLDHFLKAAIADTTDHVDMTTEVVDDTILSNVLTVEGDTSDYDRRTDSLEAISEALVPVGVIEHAVYRTEDEYALKNTNLDVFELDAIGGACFDIVFEVYLELDVAATFTPLIRKTDELNPTTYANQLVPAIATIPTPPTAGRYRYPAGDLGEGQRVQFNLAQDNQDDAAHDIVATMTYKQ